MDFSPVWTERPSRRRKPPDELPIKSVWVLQEAEIYGYPPNATFSLLDVKLSSYQVFPDDAVFVNRVGTVRTAKELRR